MTEKPELFVKAKGLIKKVRDNIVHVNNAAADFHSQQYVRHNARRLEHLSSLHLPIYGTSVLEIGAGIGDHSHYFLDRECKIIITDARQENINYLKKRYPKEQVQLLDIEHPSFINGYPFDIVYCYGLLYHLSNPGQALDYISHNVKGMLLLETCVSFGESEEINLVNEPQTNPTQAFSGTGCRPTRRWVYNQLQKLFEYAYIPVTQPNHEEFPLDWTDPQSHRASLSRAVFIASRKKLECDALSTSLLDIQTRHD